MHVNRIPWHCVCSYACWFWTFLFIHYHFNFIVTNVWFPFSFSSCFCIALCSLGSSPMAKGFPSWNKISIPYQGFVEALNCIDGSNWEFNEQYCSFNRGKGSRLIWLSINFLTAILKNSWQRILSQNALLPPPPVWSCSTAHWSSSLNSQDLPL